MGSCKRHFMLSMCSLQMITIIERQVFDFLGFMWAPIFVNFFQVLFVIFGLYGAYYLRKKFIISYIIWTFLWIGWNTFLICFYLNVGILDRDSDLLNLGTGSVSWFEVNGYGCVPTYPTNITTENLYRPLRPESVDNCLIDYPIVEVAQSGVQFFLALLGFIMSIVICSVLGVNKDLLRRGRKNSGRPRSLYSIEYGPSIGTARSRSDLVLDYDHDSDERYVGEISPKPMTPRRVKRRSVMARGSNNRHSKSSRSEKTRSDDTRSHGSDAASSGSRTMTRQSRRKYQQKPITKMLERGNQFTGHAHEHQHTNQQTKQQQFGSFRLNDKDSSYDLTVSNLQTLNQEFMHKNLNLPPKLPYKMSSLNKTHNNNNQYAVYDTNILPDPLYYNTNPNTGLFHTAQSHTAINQEPYASTAVSTLQPGGGHCNPSYQHSSINTPSTEHVDEVHNNRPPSVRSSYSNFHGTRPSSMHVKTENVFVDLLGGPQKHQVLQVDETQYDLQHIPPSTPPLYQQHPLPPPPLISPSISDQNSTVDMHNVSHFHTTQNLAYNKQRPAYKESMRSMAFLNNGPPAYNLNYHTPPDSETTM